MRRYARPKVITSYWLSASNYYVLSGAGAMAVFFVVIALFRDEFDEAYLPAGVAASVVLVTAVIVRRAILKKLQTRAYAARRLEHNLNVLRLSAPEPESKLTIEKNASILRELKRKSDAATVLARYAEGHREVYELCSQYLEINAREMLVVNAGSPRIAALRRGREIAESYHRRHMLKWAEIETTGLFERAQAASRNAEKIALAGEALAVIETASALYPSDRRLVESALAVSDFVVNVKVADLIERAGKAETRANLKLARKHLRAALDELEKSLPATEARAVIGKKIESELERLNDAELK